MGRVAEAMAQRWPSLIDDSPAERGSRVPDYETIEIGRRWYGGGAGGWSDHGESGYGPALGLWPLEAILATKVVTRADDVEVRGEPCARYLCDVGPGDVAAREGVSLVDPPGADDDWRALAADVCVDRGGLVRRVAFSPLFAGRFRPGLLVRAAAKLDRNSNPDQARASQGRLWTVIDLWDYGCQVEISAPTNLIDTEGAPGFRAIARDLWRMRRDYRQLSRQAPTDSPR